MKRVAFAVMTVSLLLIGCDGQVEMGEEGRLMKRMADIVFIVGTNLPNFHWTELHDRMAYDLKRGKSPKEIAASLLENGSSLKITLFTKAYFPTALVLSENPLVSEDGISTAVVSCSWVMGGEDLVDTINALLSKNRYEALDYMQRGLLQYVSHTLSSGDSLAPLKAESAALAYACFHALAEKKGKLEIPESLAMVYTTLARRLAGKLKEVVE